MLTLSHCQHHRAICSIAGQRAGTRSQKSLGPSKVLEKDAIYVTGVSSLTMGTGRHVASSITTVYFNEVTQNNVNISVKAIVCHRCGFGAEYLFYIELG